MVYLNSPKNLTNEFVLLLRRICLFIFWENSRTPKSPFEIIWPLELLRKVCYLQVSLLVRLLWFGQKIKILARFSQEFFNLTNLFLWWAFLFLVSFWETITFKKDLLNHTEHIKKATKCRVNSIVNFKLNWQFSSLKFHF